MHDQSSNMPTEQWKLAWDIICRRVRSVTSEDTPIIFSCHETDKAGLPLDNLDDVAIVGLAVIVADAADELFGGPDSKPFESRELFDPTWLDLCAILDQQIDCTRDQHHVCIEGVEKIGEATIKGEVISRYALLLGSQDKTKSFLSKLGGITVLETVLS